MNHVIGKERCPECAKSGRDRHHDNLGVYSDGHKYCFSCGYYESSGMASKVRNKFIKHEKIVDEPNLPEDVVPCTYGLGYEWLRQYDITTFEILQNKILWSEKLQWLIYPYYENYSITAFQARNFNAAKPYKYYTKGKVEELLWTFGSPSDSIVLVEDVVSAIKVGRCNRSMVLLGSVISIPRLMRLKHLTESIIIWLDPDKRKESIKFSNLAQTFGFSVKTIFSDKDPKEHDDSEIRGYIQGW